MRFESLYSDLSPKPPKKNLPKKSFFYVNDGPEKTSYHRCNIQGKANEPQGAQSLHQLAINCIPLRTWAPHWDKSQLLAPSPRNNMDQLLQILYEMREQMKEQQTQSDREWEWMALNRENILQKQEKLRLLNQPLLG